MTVLRFVAALLSSFVIGANINFAAVGLPFVMIDFAVPPPQAMFAWQSSIIASLVALLLGGLLVRWLPARKPFHILLTVYLVLTIASVLAGRFEIFVLARALQTGAGIVIVLYCAYFIVRDVGAPTAAAMIGPLFAALMIGYTTASLSTGWAIDRFGWRLGLALMAVAVLPALFVPTRAQKP